ncbi:MAG: FixH family protein [Hyphomicrobiales bacterium]|nr:FixH family protein [Hyphomicrobiales bacterium]MDE2114280.1 FixH family protein [Hyphomicrobiales bacterium]
MTIFWMKNAARAASLVFALVAPLTNAHASVDDYQFQLMQTTVKKADSAIIAVRLVDKRSGTIVPDAVIFTQRLDMAPDGMAEMTTTVKPLPSTEPGVYRFDVNLSAPGGWRLSLAAKVQGETGTITSQLDFQVAP